MIEGEMHAIEPIQEIQLLARFDIRTSTDEILV